MPMLAIVSGTFVLGRLLWSDHYAVGRRDG